MNSHLTTALVGAVALLASACQWTALTDPPLDPSLALVDVQGALDELSERHAAGDTELLPVWTRAHDRFEKDLEPALRERVGRVPVAEAEYRFGRVLHTLQHDGDLTLPVEDLQTELSDLVDRLTPTVAAR